MSRAGLRHPAAIVLAITAMMAFVAVRAFAGGGPQSLPTTAGNFYLRGTQPNTLVDPIQTGANCLGCHEGSTMIYDSWAGSLMAQSARDPVFYAALDIANDDAPGIGETCIRCHAPRAWLMGRSTPPDGSAINSQDRNGVNCHTCHRMVDPFNKPGAPLVDANILIGLGADVPQQSWDLGTPSLPGDGGNGSYVIDPRDQRRGPFPINPGPFGTGIPPEVDCQDIHGRLTFESRFHRRSDLCATCHDVSPPHFRPAAPGSSTLVFNGTGTAHPTGNKYEMVPEQRTYSEWLQSAYANGGVYDSRFGGPGQQPLVNCQDCHMPTANTGTMCDFVEQERDDVRQHFFSGAGNWVLEAIKRIYGSTGLGELQFNDEDGIDANLLRNRKMLKCAADLQVYLDDSHSPGVQQLLVRVVNQTGHKLPTGYPEGRRIWITVQFYDCVAEEPFYQYGDYDAQTNTLNAASTKVYETKIGMDQALADSLNRPAGPGFHLALANTRYQDNRIPPRGFTNANFAAVQAAPVQYTYADGQYWDDTYFDIPGYAIGAKVTLYYESNSREYIEFLRDTNPRPPGNRGDFLYEAWYNGGNRPQPIVMAVFPPTAATDDGQAPCRTPTVDPAEFDPDGDGHFNVELIGDINGDRFVDVLDIPPFVDALLELNTDPHVLCAADVNHDDKPNGLDIALLISRILTP